jgi:hypothetical protein
MCMYVLLQTHGNALLSVHGKIVVKGEIMDLEQITDIQQLKAMAYDELQRAEVAKQNLQVINQRIYALEQQAAEAQVKKK